MSLLKLRPTTTLRALSVPFIIAAGVLFLQDAPSSAPPATNAPIMERVSDGFERSSKPLSIVSFLAGATLLGVSLKNGPRKSKNVGHKPK